MGNTDYNDDFIIQGPLGVSGNDAGHALNQGGLSEEGNLVIIAQRPSGVEDEVDFGEEEWDRSNTLKASATQMAALRTFAQMKGKTSGTVQHLGSKDMNTAHDWDQDLDFTGASALSLHPLRHKDSFSSQLSFGDDEGLTSRFGSLRMRPSSALSDHPRKGKSSASSLSSQKEDDKEPLEADFDLPADMDRFTLSSSRSNKPSAATFSSSSTHSRDSSVTSISGDNSSRSKLFLSPATSKSSSRPRTSTTTISSSNSFSDFDNEDANFFDDIELPTYFGKPTNAAVKEPITYSKGKGKVDLQDVIAQNLKARMQMTLGAPLVSPEASTSKLPTRLIRHDKRKHIERTTEVYEEGLVINEDSFSRNKMTPGSGRTNRPPSVNTSYPSTMSKESSRRKSSSSKAALVSAASLNPPARNPSAVRISPSVTSSRTVGQRRVSITSASNNQRNPSIDNTNRTLRYKKSTPHLSSHSQGNDESFPPVPHARTLSRKQSMPLLTDVPSSVAPHIARTPRPPLPITTHNHTTRAKPTVHTVSKAFLQQRELSASPTIPPARPSTPAGAGGAVRLTMPTLSSRAKMRSFSSHNSFPAPSDPTGKTSSAVVGTSRPSSVLSRSPSSSSSLNVLSSTHVLRRPRKSYGDGTELEAFDDLPTNKEKERRFTNPGVSQTGSTSKQQRQARPGSSLGLVSAPHVPLVGSRRLVGVARRKADEKRIQPQLIKNLNASATSRGMWHLFKVEVRLIGFCYYQQSRVIWFGIRSYISESTRSRNERQLAYTAFLDGKAMKKHCELLTMSWHLLFDRLSSLNSRRILRQSEKPLCNPPLPRLLILLVLEECAWLVT